MAITSALPILELVGTSDVTLVNTGSSQRFDVYDLQVHSQNVAAVVELFVSSDSASQAVERVDHVTLGANETSSFKGVSLGINQFLIAKSDVSGVICFGKYTRRTGGDI